jgi:hypothetical protein
LFQFGTSIEIIGAVENFFSPHFVNPGLKVLDTNSRIHILAYADIK